MAIVDSHAHLGPCRVFGLNNTVDMLLEYVEQNEIDQSVVQPFPGAPSHHGCILTCMNTSSTLSVKGC